VNPQARVKQRVIEHVRELIRAGKLKRGAPLPSYHELCAALDVSYMTVKTAMDVLADEGLVRRDMGKGCFVNKATAATRRALRRIGVIYPESRETLFLSEYRSAILRGVMVGGQRVGADVHLFSLNRDGLVLADQIAEAGADGVVLVGLENHDYLKAFSRWGTPGVVVDFCASEIPLDYVACDNRAAAVRAVDHLAEHGHRRMAYLDGRATGAVRYTYEPGAALMWRNSSDVVERRGAALAELERLNLLATDGWISAGGSGDAAGNLALAAEQWRQADPDERPTAFLTYDEHVALALMAALDRQGVQVPEDVSVCAVAAAGGPAYRGRPLSCCRFDFIGMGLRAVDLLKQRVGHAELKQARIHRVGFEFIDGRTVAAEAGCRVSGVAEETLTTVEERIRLNDSLKPWARVERTSGEIE
jgi:GntR family transcriptional regulator of arabinose operon